MKKTTNKTALIATGNPDRIIEAARRLEALSWRLIGTQNVVDVFLKAGIQIESVADFTGTEKKFAIPETLHPIIEEALTCDDADLRIDLVFDVPYPIEEGHDIGGRTLLALAVKGRRWSVSDEKDFIELVEKFEKGESHLENLRRNMAAKVLSEITRYYIEFTQKCSQEYKGSIARKKYVCSEGENPYQKPCLAFTFNMDDPLGFDRFAKLSAGAPSFTNLADMDNIIFVLEKLKEVFFRHFKKQPFITVAAKHGNPCGIGVDWNAPKESIQKALWGNPQSVWGGEVICNFTIDHLLAQELLESIVRKERFLSSGWMLDLIVAPEFSPEAIALLGRRKHRVLMCNSALAQHPDHRKFWSYRYVRGGYLCQPSADFILDLQHVDWIDSRVSDIESFFIAWVAAYTSFMGGNEIALAKDFMLLGLGGGPSTLMAAQQVVYCASFCGHKTEDTVFCANAFFPFIDAPQKLVEAGCRAGIVPCGGKNHDTIRQFFKNSNVVCGFVDEAFRGFSRH